MLKLFIILAGSMILALLCAIFDNEEMEVSINGKSSKDKKFFARITSYFLAWIVVSIICMIQILGILSLIGII